MHFFSDNLYTSHFYICLWQQAQKLFTCLRACTMQRGGSVHLNASSWQAPVTALIAKGSYRFNGQVVPSVLKPVNQQHISSHPDPSQFCLTEQHFPTMRRCSAALLPRDQGSSLLRLILSPTFCTVSLLLWPLAGIITKWGWIELFASLEDGIRQYLVAADHGGDT